MPPSPGFSLNERRLLLVAPGIGPRMVERLEQAGFHSLTQLRQCGVARVVELMCTGTGSCAWANRRCALDAMLKSTAGAASPLWPG